MKDLGIYLIIGGIIIFVLVFIGKVISFIINNPLLGFASLAILAGIIIFLFGIVQENQKTNKEQS